MDLLKRLDIKLSDVQSDKNDPRVKDWFMMQSPVPTYLILGSYVLFVTVNITSKYKKVTVYQNYLIS